MAEGGQDPDRVHAQDPPDDQESILSEDNCSHLNVENMSVSGDYSFLSVKSLLPSNRAESGPKVRAALVRLRDVSCSNDVTRLLEELQISKEHKRRSNIQQELQAKMLVGVVERSNLDDLAKILSADDENIQLRACSTLEALLLDIQPSEDPQLTDQLLQVATCTQKTFLQQKQDGRLVHVLAYLHFLAVSALLSRCPPPTIEQCSPFSSPTLASETRTLRRRLSALYESAKEELLVAMQTFYKTFKSELGRPIPVWAKENWSPDQRKKRRQRYGHAHFAEQVIYVFTLLNEIVAQGVSAEGRTLLHALRDVYDEIKPTGKHKENQPTRTAFDFLLVRGLVALLRNTFEGDAPEYGRERRDHAGLIVTLVCDVVRTANDGQKKYLLQEVSDLPFHTALPVRETFNYLLRAQVPQDPLRDLVQGYMENNLQIIAFRRQQAICSGKNRDQYEGCRWVGFAGSVCHQSPDQKVEGAMFVPKASCIGTKGLLECVREHKCSNATTELQLQTAVRGERHINNHSNLQLLSPGCRHILQLWAFQVIPFPFYMTESVEERRLIGFLLDHRSQEKWLNTPVQVRICQDILEALLYLEQRGVVNADITTYNMIVEDLHGTRSQRLHILPSYSFAVKLADLGLARKLPRNATSVHIGEDHVPIRWTPQEVYKEGKTGEKGRHSVKTMVYSLGCVMFELWTHGCQPFTSDDYTPTATILQCVFDFVEQLKGAINRQILCCKRFECIPQDAYDLMTSCTEQNPSDRPALADVKEELKKIGQDEDSDGKYH
ncbi:hypothetical protein BaRGS_00016517 [Batillaria attramentaria]|uniref:Protein kinase domain-containing protein n=1 Tax=Batillaria attramentaria TaxID=370345 RepID=A0ABD0KZF2_9CAEN